MTIKVGDKLPEMKLLVAGPDGAKESSTSAMFGGKTVLMFATPGAFTPTCSARHMPGYIEHGTALREKGVQEIVCLSVNDPFVMKAWAKDQAITDQIIMLADGAGAFTRALGLELDLSARGLGMRSQRYAMVAKDAVVTHLAIEAPGDFDVSRAEAMLEAL